MGLSLFVDTDVAGCDASFADVCVPSASSSLDVVCILEDTCMWQITNNVAVGSSPVFHVQFRNSRGLVVPTAVLVMVQAACTDTSRWVDVSKVRSVPVAGSDIDIVLTPAETSTVAGCSLRRRLVVQFLYEAGADSVDSTETVEFNLNPVPSLVETVRVSPTSDVPVCTVSAGVPRLVELTGYDVPSDSVTKAAAVPTLELDGEWGVIGDPASMMAAASSGGNWRLEANLALDDYVKFTKDTVIDLNGHVVTTAGLSYFSEGACTVFIVDDGCTVMFVGDGAVMSGARNVGCAGVYNDSTLIIAGGNWTGGALRFFMCHASKIYISGGYFALPDGSSYDDMFLRVVGYDGDLVNVLYGGTFAGLPSETANVRPAVADGYSLVAVPGGSEVVASVALVPVVGSFFNSCELLFTHPVEVKSVAALYGDTGVDVVLTGSGYSLKHSLLWVGRSEISVVVSVVSRLDGETYAFRLNTSVDSVIIV